MSHVVILTAIPVEYMAVRRYLSNIQEVVHPQGTIYEEGLFVANNQEWKVAIVETGAGNSPAALEAGRAIEYFNPKFVFFVGVAGGIKDVQLGDVVAATKIYNYESGKVVDTFQPRPNVGLSSYNMVQRARAEARKPDWLDRVTSSKQPKAFVGAIAAGEKVVANTDSDTFRLLKSNYGDALAVEMEGHGILQAASTNPQVSALVIRGISDLIDRKSKADGEGYQEIASHHASAFAFDVLAKFDLVKEKTDDSNKIGVSRLKGRLKRKQEELIRKEQQRKDLQTRIEPIEQRKNIVGIEESYRYQFRLEDLKNSLNEVQEKIEILEDEIEKIQQQITDTKK